MPKQLYRDAEHRCLSQETLIAPEKNQTKTNKKELHLLQNHIFYIIPERIYRSLTISLERRFPC